MTDQVLVESLTARLPGVSITVMFDGESIWVKLVAVA